MSALQSERRALLMGLGAVLLWSTAATAFKLALTGLTPLQLVTVATLTSSVALLLALARQGRIGELLDLLRAEAPRFLVLGAINPLAYYWILLTAYDLLPAQQAQTINYTWAIVLAVLSIPILGHRLAARDWLAVILGYLGVVIIATEGSPLSMQFTSLPGLSLALISTLIWPLFWLLSTRSSHEPALALTAGFVCATPLSAVLCMVFGGGMPPVGFPLVSAIYIGCFEMGFTWLLWSLALRSATNVSRVGNLIFLSPILSLVLIATILGEPIHPATVVGFALILPGVLLQQRASGRAA
jgi:drug/metabolite transporter (DMT)-like permease